jgi:AAA domain-containing protein
MSDVVEHEAARLSRRRSFVPPDDSVELMREVRAAVPDRDSSGGGKSLEVMTARALCGLQDPPASDELLGPMLVRGSRMIIGAHTGEGKTTFALQMVRAVVDGNEFLDWRGPGGQKGLVVDAEQGLRTIKRRLREAGLDESDAVDYLHVPEGLALDSDEEDIAAVERILAAGGYAVVALDPAYKLARHTDSNVERAVVELMRRFDAWRTEYHFGLVLPVHLRKPIPGGRFSIHDVFGSNAYVRGAEVVLGLRRASNGCAELHFFKDREGDLPVGDKWTLVFDAESASGERLTRPPGTRRRWPSACSST